MTCIFLYSKPCVFSNLTALLLYSQALIIIHKWCWELSSLSQSLTWRNLNDISYLSSHYSRLDHRGSPIVLPEVNMSLPLKQDILHLCYLISYNKVIIITVHEILIWTYTGKLCTPICLQNIFKSINCSISKNCFFLFS